MTKTKGFIPINRRLFEHHLWCQEREYSTFEAWLDLIQSARFEKGYHMVGYRKVDLEVGELVGSVRYLKERWGWGSNGRVLRFLQHLEEQGMIERKTPNGTPATVIKLTNYATYNAPPKKNGTTNRTPAEQQRNSSGTNRKKVNKENNLNKREKGLPLSSFGDELVLIGEVRKELLSNQAWIEQVGITLKLDGAGKCKEWLNQFFAELKIRGETHKSLDDAKSHFVNWMKIQLKNEKRNAYTQKTSRTAVTTDTSGFSDTIPIAD